MQQEFAKTAISLLFPPEATVSSDCIIWGEDPAQIRVRIRRELKRIGYATKHGEEGTFNDLSSEQRVNFVIEAVTQVKGGASRFVANNDFGIVDEYPANELSPFYDRDVPRTDHDKRWSAACNAAGDTNALKVFHDTGRMIALKSSTVWQSLGDGVGGYDDAMGNPFPPFWLNSGMDVDGVPRNECEQIGLLDSDDIVEPAVIPSFDKIARRLAAKLEQHLIKLADEEKQESDKEDLE